MSSSAVGSFYQLAVHLQWCCTVRSQRSSHWALCAVVSQMYLYSAVRQDQNLTDCVSEALHMHYISLVVMVCQMNELALLNCLQRSSGWVSMHTLRNYMITLHNTKLQLHYHCATLYHYYVTLLMHNTIIIIEQHGIAILRQSHQATRS